MIVLLLKVTLLLGLALGVLPLMRRSSAAMRHLVCACALAGSLVLPLTLLGPHPAGAFRIDASALLSSRAAAGGTAHWPAAQALTILWAAGALALLLRIAVGHFALGRLLRGAEPLICDAPVPVYFADVSVPVVAGVGQPTILLPRAAAEWDESQREAALTHELQHIDRKDLRTLLIGHVACAVYWFHPFAWILASRSRHEQESACDDAVLASGIPPASYADALVAAARNLTSTRLIGCHMLTNKTLKSRIARLFDGGPARIPSRNGLRAAALASFAAVALVGMLFAQGQDQTYKVGNGVSSPKVLYRVDPQYTKEATDEKVEGTVLLSVVIDTEGNARDIHVIKSLGMGLDEKAVEAIRQWQFQPGMKDGAPVNVRAQIEVNFRLQ